MPDMTYEDLAELARRSEGKRLETVTGKAFTVGIARTGEIFFTPASSGYGQSDGRKAAEQLPRAIQRDRQPAPGRLRRCHAERLVLHRPADRGREPLTRSVERIGSLTPRSSPAHGGGPMRSRALVALCAMTLLVAACGATGGPASTASDEVAGQGGGSQQPPEPPSSTEVQPTPPPDGEADRAARLVRRPAPRLARHGRPECRVRAPLECRSRRYP